MKTPKQRLVKLVLSLKVGEDVEDQEIIYAVKRGTIHELIARRIPVPDIRSLKIRPHRSSRGKSASRRAVEQVSAATSSTPARPKRRG